MSFKLRKYFQYNPEIWKALPRLKFSRLNGTVVSTSQILDDAFSIYEYNLSYSGSMWLKIIIPEEWKTLTEEAKDTDTLCSVLFRSLQDYVTTFFWSSDPPIFYASINEIKQFEFPEPQIISGDVDPMKFYTRMTKALLHAFSYPGLTICRCEMDAERNTSLLLSSFFDWFAVLQPGPSTRDIIDSIRVFKRNSRPEWTTDGLVPIVFFPQQIQPLSERKKVVKVLQNFDEGGKIPDVLLPLVAAVEQTLRLLLAYAIIDWKKRRSEDFVVPDWLFIHGVVYDALGINWYTFAPRITKCDDDGVPLEWEFACIPQQDYESTLFQTRRVYKRVSNTAALLVIRRHTERICELLDNLDISTVVSPVHKVEEEAQDDTDTDDSETKNMDMDVRNSEAAEIAIGCLNACLHKTGLYSSCHGDFPSNNKWTFIDNPFDIVLNTVSASKDFMAEFMDNWQTRDSKKLLIPEDWLTTIHDSKRKMTSSRLFQVLPKSQFRMWTSKCKKHFDLLTTDALQARHFDPHSFAPDFYLSTPARIERDITFEGTPSVEDLCPDTIHSLEHFKDVYQYVSHESEAKMAVSSPFMCTPGCWLKYDTQSRFPPALATDSCPVDFSLLLHAIQTVPIEMTPLTPDVNLRATILNPALVIAIQGPTAWPGEFACSPASPQSRSRPKDKADALRQLATAIEPSLKIHLINWQLRFEQGLVPTRDLPRWFMLFGIIYDAEEVTIVAHIPYMTDGHYSFMSCPVDTIPFPPVDASSKITDPWFLDRLRVGLALLSLQKHAFHMAGLWECVVWPNELVSWEEIVEREYLGPVLTPLERGYMVEPSPMSQLYLDMHGSDETLFNHSGKVSVYGEDDEAEMEVKDEDEDYSDDDDVGGDDNEHEGANDENNSDEMGLLPN